MFILDEFRHSRFWNWSLKGGMAIIEQGLFSGSNFILNVLLARWLSPSDYGAFALGFAVYLFVSGFHNATILEPMSIFATSKYPHRLDIYFSSQFVLHFIVTTFLGLLVIVFSFVMQYWQVGETMFSQALLGVGMFLPMTLLMWLVRRSYYLLQRPAAALFATILYSACLLAGAFFLSSHAASLFWWFALMGIASLAGSLAMLLDQIGKLDLGSLSEWKLILIDQWFFGRWIALATVFYSIGTQIQIFFAASLLGFEAAGAFRALQNLMLPMVQVLTAIGTLSLSSITFEFGKNNYKGMSRKSLQVARVLIMVALGYELILWGESKWIEKFLYNGKYTEFEWLIPIVGLVPIIQAFQIRYSLILRALQKPKFYLADKLLAAICGGITAYLFIINWGIPGAIINLVLIDGIALAAYWWLFRRWFLRYLEN
jgi:O-antigen/teichoic acid export membrane protein